MKFTVVLTAALLAGVLASQANTQTPAAAGTNASPEAALTALFGNPTIVKANGFEIKRGDLDQVASAARSNYSDANQPAPAGLDATVLDKLIAIQSLLQTATPEDQAAGKAEAERQYTNFLARFGTPENAAALLKARGMTLEELRAKGVQEAVAMAALKRGLGLTVSDDEAKAFYTQHAADFEQPEMVHARHILLMTVDASTRPPTPLTTNTVAAKRKQIEDLRKRILAGEDFATLARQYSEDTGSKENGGELPNFARGQMVPEFESAAFALGTNQVSDVVTSMYGFHLIKVLEKIPAKKIDFATAQTYIKQELEQRKMATAAPAYLRKLRADQHVEIVDATLKAQDEELQAQEAKAEAEASEAPMSAPK